jgi:cytochrome c oxidase cbb3-type subunit 3
MTIRQAPVRRGAPLTLLLCAAAVACGSPSRGSADRAAEAAGAAPLPTAAGVAALPEGPYAGLAVSAIEKDATNPYGSDTAAVERGRALFVAMNCTGCHGFEAKAGLMAPRLTDNYWRYGGSDADVFNSVYEGRAQGMPAWGAVLSEDQIWELVAYIRSLGGMTGPRIPSQATYTNTAEAGAPTTQNRQHP